MKKDDKVIWLQHDMQGAILEVWPGETDYKIAWDGGHDTPFSGGTFWTPRTLFDLGQIEVLGENGNGHEKVPETLIDPNGRDLFQEAFQLSFEIQCDEIRGGTAKRQGKALGSPKN